MGIPSKAKTVYLTILFLAVAGFTLTAHADLVRSTFVELTRKATTNPTRENIHDLLQYGFDMQMNEQSVAKEREPTAVDRSKRSSPYNFHMICPNQTDQSFVYNLMSNPNGYPILPISNELFARSLPGSDLLFQCLIRNVLPQEADPVLEEQPILDGPTTCPQVLTKLWSYNSINYGNSFCWVLTNFQEDVLYNPECEGSPCLGCNDPFYSSYHEPKKKVCFPRYRTVSIWSFCLNLPLNQRVVRDRIIIPSDCSCANLRCQSQHPFNRNNQRSWYRRG